MHSKRVLNYLNPWLVSIYTSGLLVLPYFQSSVLKEWFCRKGGRHLPRTRKVGRWWVFAFRSSEGRNSSVWIHLRLVKLFGLWMKFGKVSAFFFWPWQSQWKHGGPKRKLFHVFSYMFSSAGCWVNCGLPEPVWLQGGDIPWESCFAWKCGCHKEFPLLIYKSISSLWKKGV